MYIFFECAACLILVAIVVTLLFALCALFIVLEGRAAILDRLARGIADDARVLVARQTELIRNRTCLPPGPVSGSMSMRK